MPETKDTVHRYLLAPELAIKQANRLGLITSRLADYCVVIEGESHKCVEMITLNQVMNMHQQRVDMFHENFRQVKRPLLHFASVDEDFMENYTDSMYAFFFNVKILTDDKVVSGEVNMRFSGINQLIASIEFARRLQGEDALEGIQVNLHGAKMLGSVFHKRYHMQEALNHIANLN